jgi:hypothetical protein
MDTVSLTNCARSRTGTSFRVNRTCTLDRPIRCSRPTRVLRTEASRLPPPMSLSCVPPEPPEKDGRNVFTGIFPRAYDARRDDAPLAISMSSVNLQPPLLTSHVYPRSVKKTSKAIEAADVNRKLHRKPPFATRTERCNGTWLFQRTIKFSAHRLVPD